MPFPGPYGAMNNPLFLQSEPLRQALGPLGSMAQIPGGTFGMNPFAPIPGGQAPGPGYLGGQGGPGFQGASMMGLGSMAGGGSARWWNPFSSPITMQQPMGSLYAAQEMQIRAAGAVAGSGLFAARTVGSAAMTSLAFAALPTAWGAAKGIGAAGFAGAQGLAGMPGGIGMMGMAGRMGAAALPLAPFAAAGLGIYGGLQGINQVFEGGRQFRDVFRAQQDVFGGFRGFQGAGITGRGIGIQGAASTFDLLSREAAQPFRRMQDEMRVYEKVASTGELTMGARGAKDMGQKLKQGLETVYELMKMTNSTLEQAGNMFVDLRRMGFTNNQQAVRMGLETNVAGGITGVGQGRMMEVAGGGAATARQLGLWGRAGAIAATGMASQIGSAMRSGGLSQDLLMEVTGGSMDPTVAAQQMVGRTMGALQGRLKYMVAGAMGPTGEISDEVMGQMLGGKVSLQGMLSKGVTNLGSLGNLTRFAANQQQLTSQFIEKAGPNLNAMMYQMAAQGSRQMFGGEDQNFMIKMLMSTLEISEQEAKTIMATGNPGAVAQRKRDERAGERGALRERVLTTQASPGARFETTVTTPFRSILAGAQRFVGGMYGDIMTGMERIQMQALGETKGQGDYMTPGVRRAIQMGRGEYVRPLPGEQVGMGPGANALESAARTFEHGPWSGVGRFLGMRGSIRDIGGIGRPGDLNRRLGAMEGIESMGDLGAFGIMTGAAVRGIEARRPGDVLSEIGVVRGVMQGRGSDSQVFMEMLNNIKRFSGRQDDVLKVLQEQLGIQKGTKLTMENVTQVLSSGDMSNALIALISGQVASLGGKLTGTVGFAAGGIREGLLAAGGAYSGMTGEQRFVQRTQGEMMDAGVRSILRRGVEAFTPFQFGGQEEADAITAWGKLQEALEKSKVPPGTAGAVHQSEAERRAIERPIETVMPYTSALGVGANSALMRIAQTAAAQGLDVKGFASMLSSAASGGGISTEAFDKELMDQLKGTEGGIADVISGVTSPDRTLAEKMLSGLLVRAARPLVSDREMKGYLKGTRVQMAEMLAAQGMVAPGEYGAYLAGGTLPFGREEFGRQGIEYLARDTEGRLKQTPLEKVFDQSMETRRRLMRDILDIGEPGFGGIGVVEGKRGGPKGTEEIERAAQLGMGRPEYGRLQEKLGKLYRLRGAKSKEAITARESLIQTYAGVFGAAVEPEDLALGKLGRTTKDAEGKERLMTSTELMASYLKEALGPGGKNVVPPDIKRLMLMAEGMQGEKPEGGADVGGLRDVVGTMKEVTQEFSSAVQEATWLMQKLPEIAEHL